MAEQDEVTETIERECFGGPLDGRWLPCRPSCRSMAFPTVTGDLLMYRVGVDGNLHWDSTVS